MFNLGQFKHGHCVIAHLLAIGFLAIYWRITHWTLRTVKGAEHMHQKSFAHAHPTRLEVLISTSLLPWVCDGPLTRSGGTVLRNGSKRN